MPVGYTREMREARAAQQAAASSQQGLSNVTQEAKTSIAPPVTRETRKPFGSTNQKLAYPARPGYHRHWFNDDHGRIDMASEAGYKHVAYDKGPKTGKNVERIVGTREGGHPITAFLMEITQEWRDEDMEKQETKNISVDEAIRRGQLDKVNPKDASKFYPSAQGRQISLTRGSR